MTNEQAWFLIVLCFGAVIVGAMLGAYIGIASYFLGQERAVPRQQDTGWETHEWGQTPKETGEGW